MRIFFTDHAHMRMAARRVSLAEVQAVLAGPVIDRTSQDAPDRRIFTAWPNGRKVEVVVQELRGSMRVITVWGDRP